MTSRERIANAMNHPDILGAGAIRRKSLSPEENYAAVMAEFKRGTLNSKRGKVTNARRAHFLGLAEAKQQRGL